MNSSIQREQNHSIIKISSPIQVFHSLPLTRVIFPENEGDGGRETNPTCSEDWPKAEPSSPFRVKNERPASNETSVWGLNNGKAVLSGEMNTFSPYTWKRGNKVRVISSNYYLIREQGAEGATISSYIWLQVWLMNFCFVLKFW